MTAYPAQSPGQVRQMPKAPLPAIRLGGLPSCTVASCATLEGITPPSTLIQDKESSLRLTYEQSISLISIFLMIFYLYS